MDRRSFLTAFGALASLSQSRFALASSATSSANLSANSLVNTRALIGAAWRGPKPSDTYRAGVLSANWDSRQVAIEYELPLPTRPHGLLAEADGGLLVIGVRPGSWMLRCDGHGKLMQQVWVDQEKSDCRLNGHAILSRSGEVIYTTESDSKTGRGKIGVRDRRSLRKLDEWDSGGLEPHQLLLDAEGHVMVANGGIPRTASDKKYDLPRMDSSLVRLDSQNGRLLRKWKLDDPRLSLRHMAWSTGAESGPALLGIAMQAEHDEAAARVEAPILAVLDGDDLLLPARASDGAGYAGDIAPAYNGGFALSSNQVGLAQLWHPGLRNKLTPIVELQEAYALAAWDGSNPGGGVLVSTAPGMVRWHPTAKPLFLPWPEKMALDNHWILLNEV